MNQKVWFKLFLCIFYDPKFKIMETYEERDLLFYIMIRCFDLAAITNDYGDLYINKNMPYNIKSLAVEFNRSYEQVAFAVKVLKKLEILILKDNKMLCVKNWDKYQNTPDKLEKERIERNLRVAKHRAKKKNELNMESVTENEPDFKENIIKEEACTNEIMVTEQSENILESSTNKTIEECNVTNNLENVTCNKDEIDNVTESNVTATPKIKKKNKKKIKTKKESKKDTSVSVTDEDDNAENGQEIEVITLSDQIEYREGDTVIQAFYFDNSDSENVDSGKIESNQDKNNQSKRDEELNKSCARICHYYEKITGMVGTLNIVYMKMLIDIHGEEHVKTAINKAMEQGKNTIMYINGILKNWRAEGYPKEDERVKNNGGKDKFNNRSSGEDKSFKVKPAEERKLTDEQRKKLEAEFLE